MPIYKKNDVNVPNDSRPESVIPHVAKVYETIPKTQITVYMEICHILASQQSTKLVTDFLIFIYK